MLTMGTGDAKGTTNDSITSSIIEEDINLDLTEKRYNNMSMPQIFNNANSSNQLRILKNQTNNLSVDCKRSDISCKISTSSLFYRIHGRKSRDNFANILMKIQSDLNTLSTKLSNLETKIQL